MRPEFYTGAEAIADWISTESCPLKYLDISWNTIRLDSAVHFGNALARKRSYSTFFGEPCSRRHENLSIYAKALYAALRRKAVLHEFLLEISLMP